MTKTYREGDEVLIRVKVIDSYQSGALTVVSQAGYGEKLTVDPVFVVEETLRWHVKTRLSDVIFATRSGADEQVEKLRREGHFVSLHLVRRIEQAVTDEVVGHYVAHPPEPPFEAGDHVRWRGGGDRRYAVIGIDGDEAWLRGVNLYGVYESGAHYTARLTELKRWPH